MVACHRGSRAPWAMPTNEDLIADILQADATETVADALGLDPAAFAARVLDFIQNPGAPQPVVQPAEEEAPSTPTQARTTSTKARVPAPKRGLK